MLKIAVDKCYVLHISSNGHQPTFVYKINNENIPYANHHFRDLGVLIAQNLSNKDHVSVIRGKANGKTGLIYRCFRSRNQEFLKNLYLTFVRPYSEFATTIWSPYTVTDIQSVESIQRRFTSRMPTIQHLSYPDRLSYLNLESLELRRLHVDLLELYKIVHFHSFIKFDDFFSFKQIMGTRTTHDLTLNIPRCRTNIGFNSFACRTARIWNELPGNVVYSTTIDEFKRKLSRLDLSQYLRCFPIYYA